MPIDKTSLLSVTVAGHPQAQGSMVATAGGGVRNMSRAKLGQWRASIGWACRSAMRTQPIEGPVIVTLRFRLRTAREGPMTKRPDLDKLARAVLDAMAGIVYRDDAQVVGLLARKDGAIPGVLDEGVDITVQEGV